MSIVAVVVTYNRLNLLKECLESLRNQALVPDAIIVVNNGSTDGTTEWLSNQTDLITINQKNLGGAGGFYTGIKTAYEKGFDWIWCMDDDAIPDKFALENLINVAKIKFPEYIALCGMVVDMEGIISLGHRYNKVEAEDFLIFNKRNYVKLCKYKLGKIIEIGLFSFVGPLISRYAVERAGLPNKNFFIHCDDSEYSYRIEKFGKIGLVPASIIVHKENRVIEGLYKKNVLGKTVTTYSLNKFKARYWGLRNAVWTAKRYKSSSMKFLVNLFFSYFKTVFILLFIDRKNVFKKLSVLNTSYRHGLSINLEKYEIKNPFLSKKNK